jgi:hypothetical protein
MAESIIQQSACSTYGCYLPLFKDGGCIEHYYGWNRDAPSKVNAGPMRERFWSLVKETEDCWLWRGARMGEYGALCVNHRRHLRAHRLAWELTHGPIPSGMLVCHKCDNKLCVRPDHLFLGDHFANAGDMVLKGYTSHANSDRVILTNEQVEQLAKLLSIPHKELLTAIRIVKYGRSAPSNMG